MTRGLNGCGSNRRRSLIGCLLLTVVAFGRTGETPVRGEAFQRGSELADRYCAVCHLRPTPELLDKTTWRTKVLPLVKKLSGMELLDPERSPEERQALEEWRTIWEDYILVAAPDAPLPQPPRAVIHTNLTDRFDVELLSPFAAQGYATCVHIDEAARRLYLANALDRTLNVLDAAGRRLSSRTVDSTVVDLVPRGQGWLATEIGHVVPDDRPLGRISFLPQTGDQFGEPIEVLPRLIRPINCVPVDLDQDGRDDLLVAGFGNVAGQFCWYPNLGGGGFAEEVLFDRPGAVRARVHDWNRDGRPDLFVLMAQAREGLYVFTNQGNGRFEPRPLIERPPAWGYTYFELRDFDGDGWPDLITTNGDLGDFDSCTKNYHGLRIHLNDGAYNFRERFFYPLNGAFKVLSRDFDMDGDLDLALISFFPDYAKSPEESFVLLDNQGGFEFTAASFPGSWRGRWMVMDAGDLDGDGDPDLALGAAYHFAGRGPEGMIREWKESGPSLVILRNRLRRADAPRAE
ncbi:MAG: VCBS repeat-containing protein [Verrucomicrobiales bacterium]|nr:VCBS repeat-containing protein [Verrucomicrobiales bacterium]